MAIFLPDFLGASGGGRSFAPRRAARVTRAQVAWGIEGGGDGKNVEKPRILGLICAKTR
jgi:hypothetical protein